MLQQTVQAVLNQILGDYKFMTTQEELIKAIIDKKLKEEANQEQNYGGLRKFFDNMNARYGKVANFGNRLSNIGDFLKNHSPLNKIGANMQTAGNVLQNGASALKKAIPTSSSLMNKIGSKITSALPSALTNSLGKLGIGATENAVLGSGVASAATAGTSAASSAAAAGPIGALIAIGSSILQGTNRKRAKQAAQQTQQLAQAQNDIAKARLAQISQLKQGTTNQNLIEPNIEQTPINNNLGQFKNNSPELFDNYTKAPIPENPAPQSPSTINIGQNIPSIQETKKSVFGNLANGLADFIKGFQENKNQGFSPENLERDENKGAMHRIGEGIGTATRLVQNPTIQGIIAGGLSGAITGDPLYGLGMAYKFTNNKKNSDLYRDILTKQGVDTSVSNGTITSDDMSKILTANKYQKGFMTRKDYDRLRLENGLISLEEYNAGISSPGYNPDEMINLTGLESISKAGRYAQQNKNDRSTNYFRSKNEGKNVIKVEYGEKPDSHNYTHVTYGAKPAQKNTTHVIYGAKQKTTTPVNNSNNKNNNQRVKVKSPDGKIGTVPVNQLLEAIKQGFKKI